MENTIQNTGPDNSYFGFFMVILLSLLTSGFYALMKMGADFSLFG